MLSTPAPARDVPCHVLAQLRGGVRRRLPTLAVADLDVVELGHRAHEMDPTRSARTQPPNDALRTARTTSTVPPRPTVPRRGGGTGPGGMQPCRWCVSAQSVYRCTNNYDVREGGLPSL